MLVTIAIPTYNRADGLLCEAIDSALAQTYPEVEVIVSDNCSTDSTPELMEQYADSRLRYIRHDENLGSVGNFNYCLSAATGEFFLLLHDDDSVDPDCVSACVEALERSEYQDTAGYVRTGTRLIDKEGHVVARYPNHAAKNTRAAAIQGADAVLAWMSCHNYWAFASTLFRTQSLRDLGGFSTDQFARGCDIHSMAGVALQSQRGIEIQPIKASFRKHEHTLTNHASIREWVDEWSRLYRQIVDWAPSPAYKRRFQKAGAEFFSRICYDLVSKVDSPIVRYRLFLLVYRQFGGIYLPPPIRRLIRRGKNAILSSKPVEAGHY
jgi:glycosyltransferase involved in cell wall biosynthesis